MNWFKKAQKEESFSLGVWKCPKCGGRLLNGDPKTKTTFRGGAECMDCGHGDSLAGRDSNNNQLEFLGRMEF